MNSLISNYIVIVSISGVLSTLLALFSRYMKSDFAGINAFFVLSSATAIYNFGFALELSGNTLKEIGLYLKLEYLGMPFIAPATLVMVLHFAGLERFVSKSMQKVLYAVPCLTTLMVWTNDYHHLFYRSVYFRDRTPSPLVDVVMGPWYIVHGCFTFGCIMAAAGLMIWQFNRMKQVYRRQIIVILIGLLFPSLGSFLYLIGKTPYGMDPVPLIMSITSSLYIWAILSRGLLTAAPIARENLFESMRDGVLVTDRFDILVDYNQAATLMMEGLDSASIGRPLAQLLLPAGREAVSYVLSSNPQVQEECELTWHNGGEVCHYQVRSSPIQKRNGTYAGRMMMLIDVTERTLLQNKLRLLATTDSLTGVYNRNHFMERSRELLARAHANQTPLAIILLDIDFFKNINDRFGHEYGDIALQHIVGVCRRHFREDDLFGRYGGEEFVICLPGASLNQAAHRAETIRADIEQSELATVTGQLKVTASFGVVEASESPLLSLEKLLSVADQALYTSKRKGRNAVHLANGSAVAPFQPS